MKLSSKILIQGLLCLVLAMTANAQGYYGSQQRPSTPTPPPPPPATFKQVLIEETEQGSLVKYVMNFPRDLAITKVRLKHDEGTSDIVDNSIELSAQPNGGLSKNVIVNARSLSVGPFFGKKTKFETMEDDGDGWRIYTFATPMYVYRQSDASVCKKNIQFYVDRKIGKSPEEIARIEREEAAAAEAAERRAAAEAERVAKEAAEAAFAVRTKPVVQKKQEEPYVPKEPEFTTPEKAGYTLLETKTYFDGYTQGSRIEFGGKCDCYMEGVRTFRFSNGDFATFNEWNHVFPLPYGRNDGRANSDIDYSIGDWQYTNDRGIKVRREGDSVTAKLPNGCLLVERNGWRAFLDGRGKETKIRSWRELPQGLLYLPNRKEPLEWEEYLNGKESSDFHISGYRLGNRLYDVSSDKKEILVAKAQFVDSVPYPAIASDSIIQAVYTPGCDTLLLRYANGDSLNFVRTGNYVVTSGQIHRNGGVLTFKYVNDRMIRMITYPNGDKYVGSFKGIEESRFLLSCLSQPKLEMWTGTLIKKDGTRIQYKGGQSEHEIAAKEKAQEAELERQYDALCKQYGKHYVDAALTGNVIVGMPEQLLLNGFKCELSRQSGNSKCYHIKRSQIDRLGGINVVTQIVWVTNGRVSSVTN